MKKEHKKEWQQFRIQIGEKVLLWNQVKSRIEACYSELILATKFCQQIVLKLHSPQLSPVKYTCTKQTIYIQATFFCLWHISTCMYMGNNWSSSWVSCMWNGILWLQSSWKKSLEKEQITFFSRQMKVQFTKPNMLLLGSLTS